MENVIHIVERVRTTEFDGNGSWSVFASHDKSVCDEFAELANSIVSDGLVHDLKDYAIAMVMLREIDPEISKFPWLHLNDIHYTVTTIPLRTKS
jgi:hypothetical protein